VLLRRSAGAHQLAMLSGRWPVVEVEMYLEVAQVEDSALQQVVVLSADKPALVAALGPPTLSQRTTSADR
jgi:hypothetical protein